MSLFIAHLHCDDRRLIVRIFRYGKIIHSRAEYRWHIVDVLYFQLHERCVTEWRVVDARCDHLWTQADPQKKFKCQDFINCMCIAKTYWSYINLSQRITTSCGMIISTQTYCEVHCLPLFVIKAGLVCDSDEQRGLRARPVGKHLQAVAVCRQPHVEISILILKSHTQNIRISLFIYYQCCTTFW
jgi:hypothetical protein